ncbi:NADP(H)-dependent aldo-keto reductase [Leeia aquatica]|uniref:Protein tas n=1 Tax=Leeia aquatica TaxID=2725557 RepID=A0A847S8M5_9NEIS|nr:NADP(H)-dependent aldo-keto reductase [Leeia aquatica]NLR76113.1 NADP(H)-dependent aldo-keto reductase [Leeia aquatica]
MLYHTLGDSPLKVSAICLGSMTWGEQNHEADAHAQLSMAAEHGINFIDTAEMYPVPARAETAGRTEQYLGSWLVQQARDRFIIATKAAGPTRGMDWLRPHETIQYTRQQLQQAVDNSLRRLQTDYIDLYQLHWPARYVPMFGGTRYQAQSDPADTPSVHAQLEALSALVASGKVRYIGVSNETAWGVMQFVRLAEQYDLPRIVSIQNAYSLVNRSFESALAEVADRERVPLLAYSPLAFGALSGKYLDDPAASGRLSAFPAFGGRYRKPQAQQAIARYVALARERGLDPAQMALAFVRQQPFVASTIIGVTTCPQLQSALDSQQLTLDAELLAAIDMIQQDSPNPAP